MTTVTVSPKYQVVIPSELRKALDIRPGQKIEVLAYEGRLEFIPVQPAKALRGRPLRPKPDPQHRVTNRAWCPPLVTRPTGPPEPG